MKRVLTYGVLLCGMVLTANAINYPTYRPTGNFTPVEYRCVIQNGTPMLEMHSTSQYGEQLGDNLGFYNPFTDEYESSEPAAAGAGARKAPPSGGIGAVFQRFLEMLPVKEVVDGVKIYDQDVAMGYWGSSSMPAGATWAAFCAWFAVQPNVAWAEKDTPIGDGFWLLLLCALAYACTRSYYKYKTIEDRKIEL